MYYYYYYIYYYFFYLYFYFHFMYPGISIDGRREEDTQCLPFSQPAPVTGDYSDQDGEFHTSSLRRSASCTESGPAMHRLNSESACPSGLPRKANNLEHYRSRSSQSLNLNVTTAPNSNVPVFVISDVSSSCSEGVSRLPSLFDDYFCNQRVDSELNLKGEPKDHTTSNFSLNSSLYYAHRLTKSPSYSCYSLICSSDNDEIPRINYHDTSPFSLPEWTLPPSHS